VKKNTKAFSLFSVVNFPNDQCKTTTDKTTSGLCLTASECTDARGSPEGNCANGFGVCCYLSVSASDTLISKNITYIQNEGYPNTYQGGAGNWTFRLEGNADICQIRLDFEDFSITPPLHAYTGIQMSTAMNANMNWDGYCGGTGDGLTVKTSTATMVGFDSLCGNLTGQHIYIHNSFNIVENIIEDAAVITIHIGSIAFASRRWKIKTTRIECWNPNTADEGCLQWFTDLGGQVQSFNKVGQQTHSNLMYNICIRRAEGYCGMSVSKTRTADESFNLQINDDENGLTNPLDFNAVAANLVRTTSATGTECLNEYIGIANTNYVISTYCGGQLSKSSALGGLQVSGTIHSNVLPLRIEVFSNYLNRSLGTGWDLTYRQTPCSK